MKKDKKKDGGKKPASHFLKEAEARRANNGIGLPENVRVVYSEENNPNDG
ncbi:MAG: hypothetical protein ACOYU3_05120 [Bacillota bacterium]